VTTALVLATLAMFDLLLAGFRAVAGRDGRIAKAPLFQAAIARAAAWGAVAISANIALVLALGAWPAMLAAGHDAIWVFGSFATLTALAIVFWFAPQHELRLVPTILVLGPLTLVRPLVITLGLAWAAARSPEPRVWIAAAVAGFTMLAFEHVLGRAHAQRWRRLVAQED
jgi:hypothetical protein